MDPLLWLSAAAIVAALLFSIPFIQRLFMGKRGEIRPAQDGMIISTIKAMINIYGWTIEAPLYFYIAFVSCY